MTGPMPPTSSVRRLLRSVTPEILRSQVRAMRARRLARMAPVPGAVDLGDLARVTPISDQFGFDRGTPIDRHYIERFLARHSGAIRGRVLEIGDDSYCRRFGGGAITQQDVLHVAAGNPGATITGDLSCAGLLPEAAFDCMVITQTLHLIYDMPAAVRELRRGLRPGGVLLLTVPGITPIARDSWGENWFWSLTGQSAQRLFAEAFGEEYVEVAVSGNVFAATCFLQGLAVEDIDSTCLEPFDPCYPVTIAVRAVCPA